MSNTDTGPRTLRVHQVELDGDMAACFAVPEETRTEWLEATNAVALEDAR